MRFDAFAFCIGMAVFFFIRDARVSWKARKEINPYRRLGYLLISGQAPQLTHIWAAAAFIIGALR